ncbi:PDDEXK-like family protein [Gaopeijia maritima]|uniref:PDDEXK-like family protein n=1 Tax=Gaopeijia maritima TaxID=3119007 RepID=UPI0032857E70
MPTSTASDSAILEAFLIENPELERLEQLLGEFNLFEAAGVVRQELRHSDFLGFLLDPQQTHGLGDSFLTLFLRRVVQASNLDDLPFSAIDVTLWDLSDTEVRREWRNVDLLIVNRTHEFVIAVENKIGTGEHSNQLQRYREIVEREFRGWRFGGLYLTPDGDQPSDSAFVPVSYELVQKAVSTLVDGRSAISEEVRTAVRHYDQLLQRHVVSDSEIAELCRRIYRRHKRALDLIFEHKPDRIALAQEFIASLVGEDSGLVLDQAAKSYVRFAPVEWDTEALRQGAGWSSSGRMLLFETFHDYRGIAVRLLLGPGPVNVRQHLLQSAVESSSFHPSSGALNRKWNYLLPARVILSAADLDELDEDALYERVRAFWTSFRSERLPLLVAAFQGAIDTTPPGPGHE